MEYSTTRTTAVMMPRRRRKRVMMCSKSTSSSARLSLWLVCSFLFWTSVTSFRSALPQCLRARTTCHDDSRSISILVQSSRPASSSPSSSSSVKRRKRPKPTVASNNNNNNRPTTTTARQRRRKVLAKTSFSRNALLDHDILTKQQEQELGQAIQLSLQLQDDLLVHVNAKKQELALRAREQQSSQDEWFLLMGQGNSKPFADDTNNDYDDDDDDDDDDLASLSVMDLTTTTAFDLDDTMAPLPKSYRLPEHSNAKFFLQDSELDLLSDQEMQDLVGLSRIQVQSILLQGAVARDSMIRNNVRLVVDIAKNWSKQKSRGTHMNLSEMYMGSWDRPSLDEVIQEGIAGLIQAVERFDPTRNIKFSTFATVYITNKVRICFQVTSTQVKIPPIFHIIRQKFTQRLQEYHRDGKTVPPMEDLAQELGITTARLEMALRTTQSTLSIDSPMYGNNGPAGLATSGDTLADALVDDQRLAEEVIELSFLRQALETAMATELGPTERDVLRLRLGLDDGVTRTHREIAEEFGNTISWSQVGRVEKRALSKLRSPNSLATYKFLAYLDFAGIDSSTARLE